ncbi:unnamed protein product [Caenorhabditis auriculariae]|uniref:Uncharacterized protein n=1 Tax=Caenorhabditis auriculariae TaxID=2777116 RepID=A0A8S1HBL4_9PELO|nr:unnamed protein product [Caenorhabditis auriculariae]
MEYNEENENFKLLGCLHIKHATFACGLIGIIATLSVFAFGIAVFPWKLYEQIVNITAMAAFACFLVGGVGVHVLVLYGLHTTRFRFMAPSVLYQAFLMVLNGITSLIAVGELASENVLSPRDRQMAHIVLCTCPPIFVCQAVMITVVLRSRYYIQCKRRYIRNGLPPPVREVIHLSAANKVGSIDISETREVSPTLMPTTA